MKVEIGNNPAHVYGVTSKRIAANVHSGACLDFISVSLQKCDFIELIMAHKQEFDEQYSFSLNNSAPKYVTVFTPLL